jgi:cytochrome c553
MALRVYKPLQTAVSTTTYDTAQEPGLECATGTAHHPKAHVMTAQSNLSALLLALIIGVLPGGAMGASEIELALRAGPAPENGEVLYRTCAACHQPDGSGEASNAIPMLAGQHFTVLVEQLVRFRTSKRTDPRMTAFASHHLPRAQDVADVSAYIAALPAARPAQPISQHSGVALLYSGQCGACHGADGRGNGAARYPALAGQHYEYLLRQMQAMASGERPAAGWDHARLLSGISSQDQQTIAHFLAGR